MSMYHKIVLDLQHMNRPFTQVVERDSLRGLEITAFADGKSFNPAGYVPSLWTLAAGSKTPARVEGTVDSNGKILIPIDSKMLTPGLMTFQVKLRNDQGGSLRFPSFPMEIDHALDYETGGENPDSLWEKLYSELEQARAEAVISAAEAAEAKSLAEACRNQSCACAAASLESKTAAEEAKTEATAAKEAAETARSAAESAQSAAENAQNGANAAKASAEQSASAAGESKNRAQEIADSLQGTVDQANTAANRANEAAAAAEHIASHAAATKTSKGIVQIGDGISVTPEGVISSTDTVTRINGKTGEIEKADIVALDIPAQDTTYNAATISEDGLMSAADKKKLDEMIAITNEEIDAAIA